jgi:peroxiredoxin
VRRISFRAVLLTGAAALALAGCSSADESGGSAGSGTRFVQGDDSISRAAAGQRPQAPDITGTTLDGKPLKFADYRGKVIVVNVWASWCPPCRAEASGLEKVYKNTQSQGVEFIGINTRDPQKENAQAFYRTYGITFPSLYDPEGKLLLKFPKGILSPQSIPSTLVIDRKGRIAARASDGLSEKRLQSMIDPLIAEKP